MQVSIAIDMSPGYRARTICGGDCMGELEKIQAYGMGRLQHHETMNYVWREDECEVQDVGWMELIVAVEGKSLDPHDRDQRFLTPLNHLPTRTSFQ